MVEMKWFKFTLKSTNFVIVKATERKVAQEKFASVWPKENTRIREQGYMDIDEIPDGAVEILAA